ncbi:RNA-processing protein [Candidatus Woesearchaeota archaeon CG_4_10_14_0_2_um_filter_33_13]|nr:MAG: RNA-processing protein [Candidatus Woesearchaeota archaeon CG_4_10_14_0_2_um_filter_33_13]
MEENTDEFAYDIKIPEERVAVLVGTDGETKKLIEEQSGCKLDISREGDVHISGDDGLKLFTTREIVRAIARGFNPKIALLLLKGDYAFELVELKDVFGKNKNDMLRVKGRIIGKGGKSREEIERLTETYLSVYGKTVGIIGEVDHAALARQAVAMLIDGAMHKTVYQFLEKKKKEMMFIR